MEFTKEQKNHLADLYANGKSSSDVFREQHKADFIAGFEKALSLLAVVGQNELLLAFGKFIDADCDLLGNGYIEEMVKKFEASNSH